MMEDAQRDAIIAAVLDLVSACAPDLFLRQMYGGTVFEREKDSAATLVGGVFGSANHVSVEFSKGARFDDPARLLEGKGKLRRHLKLHSIGDIAAKDVAGFLQQALVVR